MDFGEQALLSFFLKIRGENRKTFKQLEENDNPALKEMIEKTN